MTETNFRALCEELLQELCCCYKPWELKEGSYSDAMKRANAALAQPEPKTRLAIEPVAVTERLPEPEDCDGKGRCWIFDPGDHVSGPVWAFEGSEEFQWLKTQDEDKVQQASQRGRLTWLPHYALPLPTRGFI